jgi:Bacterial Ig domain
MNRRIAHAAQIGAIVLALALVPVALAGKPGGGGGHGGGGGGGGSTSCTQNAPGIVVQNTYGWSQWGSWGLPGQRLGYFIQVINYDVGCGSSSFTLSVSAPSGFSVSIPTTTISLASGASGYLWAYVTSPSTAADADYPLTATVARTGASTVTSTGSSGSYYKVYSSDSVAPTLFWPNPGDGSTITGRSYNVSVSSTDDHAVKKIDLYIDNVYKTETLCDGVSYTCQLNYSWSPSSGQHTATFKSYDWMDNVGVSTVSFTVG